MARWGPGKEAEAQLQSVRLREGIAAKAGRLVYFRDKERHVAEAAGLVVVSNGVDRIQDVSKEMRKRLENAAYWVAMRGPKDKAPDELSAVMLKAAHKAPTRFVDSLTRMFPAPVESGDKEVERVVLGDCREKLQRALAEMKERRNAGVSGGRVEGEPGSEPGMAG